ncbi:uncharacterized protein LOC117134674 [Drosophila busckii]|uniref:uncharacterized protein LOC117134674 n=1 Tax=Drosophila busckii TaxID=30019 RepID=UPI00143314A4|nr:uncharacterized protein LOC117134674 [Drosophila busckii]
MKLYFDLIPSDNYACNVHSSDTGSQSTFIDKLCKANEIINEAIHLINTANQSNFNMGNVILKCNSLSNISPTKLPNSIETATTSCTLTTPTIQPTTISPSVAPPPVATPFHDGREELILDLYKDKLNYFNSFLGQHEINNLVNENVSLKTRQNLRDAAIHFTDLRSEISEWCISNYVGKAFVSKVITELTEMKLYFDSIPTDSSASNVHSSDIGSQSTFIDKLCKAKEIINEAIHLINTANQSNLTMSNINSKCNSLSNISPTKLPNSIETATTSYTLTTPTIQPTTISPSVAPPPVATPFHDGREELVLDLYKDKLNYFNSFLGQHEINNLVNENVSLKTRQILRYAAITFTDLRNGILEWCISNYLGKAFVLQVITELSQLKRYFDSIPTNSSASNVHSSDIRSQSTFIDKLCKAKEIINEAIHLINTANQSNLTMSNINSKCNSLSNISPPKLPALIDTTTTNYEPPTHCESTTPPTVDCQPTTTSQQTTLPEQGCGPSNKQYLKMLNAGCEWPNNYCEAYLSKSTMEELNHGCIMGNANVLPTFLTPSTTHIDQNVVDV